MCVTKNLNLSKMDGHTKTNITTWIMGVGRGAAWCGDAAPIIYIGATCRTNNINILLYFNQLLEKFRN